MTVNLALPRGPLPPVAQVLAASCRMIHHTTISYCSHELRIASSGELQENFTRDFWFADFLGIVESKELR